MIQVSVCIVSRHRPQALVLAMMAVAQQDHPALELVVVADPAGAAAARATGLPAKVITHDAEGIGAARNAGLDAAAGEVIAFLDDDAVPEPTWAGRLAAPFADPAVMQAAGFVLGPDGMRWQWRAIEVDSFGQDHPFDAPDTLLRQGSARRAVKTQGTNCAFRAGPLRDAGGFDPGFRFYLDDADLNLRLAHRGLSAVVPGAVVHHGHLPSRRRRADLVPVDLSDIATSLALFLKRHAPAANHAALLAAEAARQRARLIRHMIAGRIEPRDVHKILATFVPKMADPSPLPARHPAGKPFLGLPTGPRPGLQLVGRPADLARLTEAARQGCDHAIVTVICLSLTFRRRRQKFLAPGYWLIVGGVPGRGAGPRRRMSLAGATADEAARLAAWRPMAP